MDGVDRLEERLAGLEARMDELGSAMEALVTDILPRMRARLRELSDEGGADAPRTRAGRTTVRANWPDCERVRRLWADGSRSFNAVARLSGIPFSTVRRYCRLVPAELERLREEHGLRGGGEG
jgi:hypothetical protein